MDIDQLICVAAVNARKRLFVQKAGQVKFAAAVLSVSIVNWLWSVAVLQEVYMGNSVERALLFVMLGFGITPNSKLIVASINAATLG